MSNWDVESGDRAALLRTMLEEPTPENHRRSASQELRDIENQYRSQPSTQKIYYGEAVLADVLKAEKEADLAHKNYLLSSGESLQFGDVEVRATLNVKNELHLNEMGLIEGVGSKLYIKSGKKVEGVFENGKLVNGLISLPDGTYEKGIFRNGGLINGKRFCAKTGIEFLGKFYSGGCLIDGRKYHPAQKNLINHTPQGHDKFKTTILYPSGAVKSKGVFFNSNGRLAKGEKYSEVGELLQSGEFSKENGQLLEGTSHTERFESVGKFKSGYLTEGKRVDKQTKAVEKGHFVEGVLIDGFSQTPFRKEAIVTKPSGTGYCCTETLHQNGNTFKIGIFSLSTGKLVEGKVYRQNGSIAEEGVYSEKTSCLIKGKIYDEFGNMKPVNNFLQEPKLFLKAQIEALICHVLTFVKRKR